MLSALDMITMSTGELWFYLWLASVFGGSVAMFGIALTERVR